MGFLHENPIAGYGFVINDHFNVGDLDPEYWAPIEVNTKYGGGLGCGVTGKDAGGWSVSACFFLLDRYGDQYIVLYTSCGKDNHKHTHASTMKHELHIPSIIQAGDTWAIRNGAPNQLASAGGRPQWAIAQQCLCHGPTNVCRHDLFLYTVLSSPSRWS